MKPRSTADVLGALRALARYQTHGGYVWAAVTSDAELLCVRCVRDNYRRIFRATADPGDCSGWRVLGLTHCGETDAAEWCAHCADQLWEDKAA